MKMRATLVALMLALAGCAGLTPEEIEAQRQAIAEQDMQTCQEYGVGPGHQDFASCRLVLQQMREQRAIAEYQSQSQAALANQQFGLQMYGLYSQPRGYAAPRTNCTTFDAGGGVMRTRCW